MRNNNNMVERDGASESHMIRFLSAF